jgi:hypothetical protein
MNRSRNSYSWPLLLLPLVCFGNELVIPELGVSFKSLPASTAGSQVLQRRTASEAITPIGAVILSVRRENAEAPREEGVLALMFLQNRIFGVPADWEESGAQSQRFNLELQFPVAPAGASCGGPPSPPRVAETPVVQVCLQAP